MIQSALPPVRPRPPKILAHFTTAQTWPHWLPEPVRLYLSHTHDGQSLRALARARGVHASTVMRHVRRYESRRDDPLMDAALNVLTAPCGAAATCAQVTPAARFPTDHELTTEAKRVLRRLLEPGALMAFANDMEMAVIIRQASDGTTQRLATVTRQIALAFCLKDWLTCRQQGRISTYEISAHGRTALRSFLLADLPQSKRSRHDEANTSRPPEEDGLLRRNFHLESPIAILARRREKDGTFFLQPALVQAAERLREDYELAQMAGLRIYQSPMSQTCPENYLSPTDSAISGAQKPRGQTGPDRAFARLSAALNSLGPGLADIVFKTCCQLEGIETAEAQLGWAARSGKVVLRIALVRLKMHYDMTYGTSGPLIG